MGFLTFGDDITSNVIDNYPVDALGANMVRVAVGLSCMACIPFQVGGPSYVVLGVMYSLCYVCCMSCSELYVVCVVLCAMLFVCCVWFCVLCCLFVMYCAV